MQSLEIEISVLQETLVDCELTIAERVEIRQEIADLKAELAQGDIEAEIAELSQAELNALYNS
tara:strand:+ start:481 stop:669 length:189 start_codon:yes stop_codon:yes gene_type:complete